MNVSKQIEVNDFETTYRASVPIRQDSENGGSRRVFKYLGQYYVNKGVWKGRAVKVKEVQYSSSGEFKFCGHRP